MHCYLILNGQSMSDDETQKRNPEEMYWITDLATTSVKSPYAIRFTLQAQPQNEEDIKSWLKTTFGFNHIYRVTDSMYYAEIFFKNSSDASAFVLRWGDSFV